jgi:hypothetical protein
MRPAAVGFTYIAALWSGERMSASLALGTVVARSAHQARAAAVARWPGIRHDNRGALRIVTASSAPAALLLAALTADGAHDLAG